jgi:hypothetical protein
MIIIISMSPDSRLAALREKYRALPSPIIIYNKSHSGSRLLARLLEESGVFMGAHQNASRDSLDIFELVHYLVVNYYPDYNARRGTLSADAVLAELIDQTFRSHLAGYDPGGGSLWGWKLCETSYIVPVLDSLFPRAKFIHLLRDGRDVAFCDHRGPRGPFWRKVYFNSARIKSWQSLWMNKWTYPLCSYYFNSIHWANAVRVGRAYGSTLGDRYLEVRYEDLVLDYESTAAKVIRYAGLGEQPDAVRRLAPSVRATSVHKYQRQSAKKLRCVTKVIGPDLVAFGYLNKNREARSSSAALRPDTPGKDKNGRP